MKFNYIYYTLLIIFLIWSHFIPQFKQVNLFYEETDESGESLCVLNPQAEGFIKKNIYLILHYLIFILMNIFLEPTLQLLMDESNCTFKQIIKNAKEDILISIHRDYALDGIAGMFFNRYTIKVLCLLVRLILITFFDKKYTCSLTIFSIFYDMSRACRWRIIPNYDFEEPYSERTPYFAEAVVGAVGLSGSELNEDLKEIKQREVDAMNANLTTAINNLRGKLDALKEFLFHAINAANGVVYPDGLDVDVNGRLHIRLEPGQALRGEQDKVIREEISALTRDYDDLTLRQRDLHMKWLEDKVYQARNYTKVRIEKMEDLEKYAEGHDHFIYTRTKGKLTFTSKIWKKFEDGLYEYTKDSTYKIVQVTTDSKFVNKLCIQANAQLQKLLLTPPKVECTSIFGITDREKYLLLRCHYAKKLYNMLTAYCQGNIKFIEILNPEEYEALISFACSHAFGNRGLGRFEQWMNLDSNEFFTDMGFQLQN